MGRRSGFAGLINQAVKAQARAQRQAVADYNRHLRLQERLAKQQLRDLKQQGKEEKQQYLLLRQDEVDDLNAELNLAIESLQSILEQTLAVNDNIAFDSLRIKDAFGDLRLPKELSIQLKQPDKYDFKPPYKVKKVGFLEKIFHGEKGKANRIEGYEHQHQHEWHLAYENAKRNWEAAERRRLERIDKLTKEYEQARLGFETKLKQRNAEVDEFENAYNSGELDAIINYNVMVLERSGYPEGFPQEFRLAYASGSRELVIEYELPTDEIVPGASEFKYVRTKDEIQEKLRKPAEVKALYQDLIASVCLRTIHEVLEADQGAFIDIVTLNGFVQTVDRTTGRDIRPHLISTRVTKDRFLEIDLRRIDKKACLRNLGAQVSPSPTEYVAVKPIVNFDMVDRRFVEGSDVLSELDARPNLMDLTPFEFENLVGNLFKQMGLDTRQTQTSRDGGVDVIAYDTRPVFGGKVVIQAKRYKNTVGVSAARDLYGTMINEGASKGILITTSQYGKDTYEFVKDKPIELLDGPGMLYLLEHHANVRARIIMPEEPKF